MSPTAAGDYPAGWARAVETLAHRPVPVALVIITLTVTGTIIGAVTDPDVGDALYLVASVIGLLWTGAQMHHTVRDHLCVRCMQDMPTDPGAAIAGRRHRWLRLHHRILESRPWTIGWILLVVGCSAPAVLGWSPGRWLIFLPQAAFAWLTLHHRRVRPWCPYCRGWGDGGRHEHAPTPDPAGTKTSP